jgi:uncharacterized membrane protein YfcA
VKTALFVLLGAFALFHIANLIRCASRSASGVRPTGMQVLIGFVTNFFDTLGIGNFAPTTVAYRWLRIVPDELIPGTMNVGHTLPVIAMAFIFIGVVEVETVTLLTMIGAAVLGAWLGAGLVTTLPRRAIQVGMGIALLAAAGLFTMTQFEAFPVGGEALALGTGELVFAAVGIFVCGALMTIGVGLYAPCMILVALLGMNPKAAFPIMMGACAFLMPVASAKFIRSDKHDVRPSFGLTLGGLPAVFLAVWLFENLSVTVVRWFVIAAALISGVGMLRAGGAMMSRVLPGGLAALAVVLLAAKRWIAESWVAPQSSIDNTALQQAEEHRVAGDVADVYGAIYIASAVLVFLAVALLAWQRLRRSKT